MTQARTEVARREEATQWKTVLRTRKDEFAAALASRIDPDAFVRVAYTTIAKSPRLAQATPASVLMALLECASLGLMPNGVMGEAYLVPYNNKVKTPGEPDRYEMQAQFQPGYRGLVKLARQSGVIRNIVPGVVRKGDEFEVERGLTERLVHRPNVDADDADPSSITHVYAIAHFTDGGAPQFEVMGRAAVERIRRRSKSATDGPWVTDWEPMAIKTVIRRLFKYLPASDVDLSRAIEADNKDFRDIAELMAEQAATSAAERLRAIPVSAAPVLPPAPAPDFVAGVRGAEERVLVEMETGAVAEDVAERALEPAPAAPPPAPSDAEALQKLVALLTDTPRGTGRGAPATEDQRARMRHYAVRLRDTSDGGGDLADAAVRLNALAGDADLSQSQATPILLRARAAFGEVES
jgi:phage RecT family recombinase